MQKYDWPEKIPDEVIRRQFADADQVSFSARSFNTIQYRSIAFGNLGWWLPLSRVLPLVGITPQMLRPVFNLQGRTAVELPAVIETYEQLGGFRLVEGPFRELARIFGKSVKVLREDGATGDHHALFIVRPSGEIAEAAKE